MAPQGNRGPLSPHDRMIRGLRTPAHQRPGMRKPVNHDARSRLQHGKHSFSNPMTYQQWKKATEGGVRHPRSLRLRSVDKAIRNWTSTDRNSLPVLQFALMKWVASKRDWKASIRNRDGAVEILKQQAFMGYTGGNGQYPIWLPELGIEGMKALDFQIRSSQDLFDRYFLPRGLPLQMKLKLGQAAKTGAECVKDLKKAAQGQKKDGSGRTSGSADAGARSKVEAMIANLFGEADVAGLKGFLRDAWVVHQVQAEFGATVGSLIRDIADVMPVISTVKGAVDTIGAWGKAAKKTYEIKTFGDKKINIQAGDMRAAYGKFMTLVKKDAGKAVKDAATKTYKLIADSGSQGAASPATTLFNKLAKLAAKIFAFALQLREQHNFNRIIRSKSKEARRKLLTESPFAACMLLAHGNTSDVLSFGAYVFGRLTWMEDVEALIKNTVAPVQKRAKAYADEYPFTIAGFMGTKAVGTAI